MTLLVLRELKLPEWAVLSVGFLRAFAIVCYVLTCVVGVCADKRSTCVVCNIDS